MQWYKRKRRVGSVLGGIYEQRWAGRSTNMSRGLKKAIVNQVRCEGTLALAKEREMVGFVWNVWTEIG